MTTLFEAPARERPLEDGDSGTSTLHGEEDHIGAQFEMINMKGSDSRGMVISIQETPINEQRISSEPAEATEAPQTAPTSVPAMAPVVLPPPPKRFRGNSRGSASPLRITTTIAGPGAPSPPLIGQISSTQRTYTSSPTLVRNASAGSTGTHSPVMRSMFPRYEPGVLTTRQPHNPVTAKPNEWQGEVSTQKPNYTPSMYSQSGTPPQRTMSSWKPTRANMHASPLHNSELPPPNLSSQEDLLDLWSIANGEGAVNAAETFTLGLRCDDLSSNREAITFTSSTHALYSLNASSHTINICRTAPLPAGDSHNTIPICNTLLTQPAPDNPLISSIFPTQASQLALSKASAIAASHNLSRSDAADLRAEALLRMRDAEASNLLWDNDSTKYYLIHPTLAPDREPATLPFSISETDSTISLLSSTAPDADPFLTLSLATNVLTIFTASLAPLESLYAVDTFLCALLTLLLHLHRTATRVSPQLGNGASTFPSTTAVDGVPMTLNFAPPPSLPVPAAHRTSRHSAIRSQSRTRTLGGRSRPASVLTANTAHTAQTFQAQYEASQAAQREQEEVGSQWGGGDLGDVEKGVAPELQTNGVDLTRFQNYDLEDKSLPFGTRACLRVLYWFFGVLVWIMGVVVGVVAAVVVGVGGWVKRL